MTRIRKLVSTSALAAALCLTGGPARADNGAEEAARAALEKHGGRVLKVDEKKDAYRVKLLQDSGKVKILELPRLAPKSKDSGSRKKKSGKKKRSGRDD